MKPDANPVGTDASPATPAYSAPDIAWEEDYVAVSVHAGCLFIDSGQSDQCASYPSA